MPVPKFAQEVVVASCLLGMRDAALIQRCSAIANDLRECEANYQRIAGERRLHAIPAHGRGDDSILSIPEVTRGELKALYTNQMAKAGRPARGFYDKIKMSAKDGLCPYCGIGSVETLDHFLPKGRYSSLSVLPMNLVPACRDCNTGKLDSLMLADSEASHPYFEDSRVSVDRWLYAEIIEADEPFAEFTFHGPDTWPDALSRRVKNHFDAFDLARRFSVQAAGRYPFYANMIDAVGQVGAVPLLTICQTAEAAAHGVNSWQSALALAILGSEYFVGTAYLHYL